MNTLIDIKNLTKNYGPVKAVSPLDLNVTAGQSWAIIGQNGAGKTTILKILLNVLPPTTGEIQIEGRPHTDIVAHELLTYLPEKFSFFMYMTVFETLKFFAGLRGLKLSHPPVIKNMNEVLARLKIDDLKDRKLSTLSKGQLQRLGLAQLLIHPENTNLYILDEPFSGLDPIGIRDLKQLLREEKQKGRTILISSHLLSEVEQLVDSVFILHKGRLLESCSLESIREKGTSLEAYFCRLVEGVLP